MSAIGSKPLPAGEQREGSGKHDATTDIPNRRPRHAFRQSKVVAFAPDAQLSDLRQEILPIELRNCLAAVATQPPDFDTVSER